MHVCMCTLTQCISFLQLKMCKTLKNLMHLSNHQFVQLSWLVLEYSAELFCFLLVSYKKRYLQMQTLAFHHVELIRHMWSRGNRFFKKNYQIMLVLLLSFLAQCPLHLKMFNLTSVLVVNRPSSILALIKDK